jgi:hypothetical protein
MGGELPEVVSLRPDPARRERTRWAMRRAARGAVASEALAWSGAAACVLWALGVVWAT